jgi:hypothetical protein
LPLFETPEVFTASRSSTEATVAVSADGAKPGARSPKGKPLGLDAAAIKKEPVHHKKRGMVRHDLRPRATVLVGCSFFSFLNKCRSWRHLGGCLLRVSGSGAILPYWIGN